MHKLITRMLPAAAVAAGLIFTAPAADAKTNADGKKTPIAKIALGDKRVKSKAAKATPKARLAAVPCQNTDAVPTAENLDQIRATLLCLHNQIRAEKGLSALKDSAKLRKAAQGHSNDMVAAGFFAHTSPDGDTFVDRILGAGYAKRNDAWTIGENLAWGTGDMSTPAGMMQAWMNSAGHKANILKKSYREVGIAIRLGVPSDGGVGATVTADFGAKL